MTATAAVLGMTLVGYAGWLLRGVREDIRRDRRRENLHMHP